MSDDPNASEAFAAARQAGVVFSLAGVFTLTAFATSSIPGWAIVAVATGHAAAAVVAWVAPWKRWGLMSTASLGLVAIVLLSATTFVFDGYASGLGPMFVLVFAWLGLHYPLRVIAAAVPIAALGYATALLAVDARTRLVVSTLVLIPIAVTVSLLISRTVGQLRVTQEHLHVKDRWRAALMATLAHDVRSPLTSVMGTLEIVEEDPTTEPKYRPLLGGAIRQTKRVLRLAKGILEAERIEQGKLRLDRREINLKGLAEETARLTDAEHVTVEVPSGMVVVADAERLEQILYNLANNALRHGRPPVIIGARESEGYTEVFVRDHGAGVPTEDVMNLFDRFSSADHSPQSVGLGLWIVKLLADSHSGSVHYEPADPGARFVITLPRVSSPVASRAD